MGTSVEDDNDGFVEHEPLKRCPGERASPCQVVDKCDDCARDVIINHGREVGHENKHGKAHDEAVISVDFDHEPQVVDRSEIWV